MSSFTAFDDDFENSKPQGNGGTVKKEDLPDGEYECDIAEVNEKTVRGAPLVVVTLQIVDGQSHAGSTFTHEYWFRKADGSVNDITMNQLQKDLTSMGLEADQWKSQGRRFSTEMPKCILVMKGMRLAVKKKTNPSGGKVYHNVYLNKRLLDGKPNPISATELTRLAAESAPADPFS